MPIGTVISVMGKIAPSGYLACDGSTYNISEYQSLSNYFKIQFGSVNYFGGDGTTTFAVPDLRGEFLRGSGTADRNSGSGGEVGEHQDATFIPNVYVNRNNVIGTFGNSGQDVTSINADGVQRQEVSTRYVNLNVTSNTTNAAITYSMKPTNTSILYCIRCEEQITTTQVITDTPIGQIIAQMGNNAPEDYLKCDGSTYNISEYPELANHFYTEFGSVNYFGGDGTTTFGVPDLRGEFLRGTGTNSHQTQGSGTTVGGHQDATTHNYIIGTVKNIGARSVGENELSSIVTNNDNYFFTNGVSLKYVTNATVVPVEDNLVGYMSRPTNTSVLYCIKCRNPSVRSENSNYQQNIYSTEEVPIGIYKDGKTIYRRIIPISGTIETTSKEITSISLSYVDNLLNVSGNIFLDWGNNQQGQYSIPYFTIDDTNGTWERHEINYSYGTSQKILWIIGIWSDVQQQVTGEITIEYTKI